MKTTTFSRFTSLNKFTVLACLAGLLFLAAPQLRADDEDTSKDPPKRVARISIVEGSVSMQPGGEGDWGNAAKNRPVTIGDKIWVDKDSRAELQAGEAAFHLGSMTALSFLNLDEGITQVRIPEGAVNFRVRELRQGDVYEVDTPNVVFNVKQAGDFRVDVNEAGDSSRITAIRGEGEISVGGKTYEVHAGEQAEFSGGEDNPSYSIMRAPSPDGLDQWAQERDLKEDRSASGNYVSRDIPGFDDLDDHGSWSDEPEYGHVWYPNDVGPEWAPYSDGYWNWVDPWGWSWVGYEPWGFAPYHYGRWAFIGGRWGWCPGAYYGYPVYGPAFVGWLGGGWGFGLGFGVGWFPLGWGEPFFPWYHCGRGYINVINVHNTFIRNVNVLNNRNFNFVNAHNLRAVTTTSRNNFMNGGRVNRGGQHLTEASLRNARVTNSVGIHPAQHSSLGASNFNSHVARPSNAIQNRAVMARTAPARAASHESVRTMNAGRFGGAQVAGAARVNGGVDSAARANGVHNNDKVSGKLENRAGNAPANSGHANSEITARQRALAQDRPPSARGNSNLSARNEARNNSAERPANNSRTWEAQGNTTDRGRAPQGFGSNRPAPAQDAPRSMNDRPTAELGSNRPANAPAQNSPRTMSDRPPWAGNGGARSSNGVPSGRSYEPSQRGSSPTYGPRGYAQQPSYSPRTYSSPGRSYPAPSRSYSPPSRSYSGGNYGSSPRSYSGGGSRSYGGGGYSAPRSYGGGGGSYHGGGGSFGGGSHSSGGFSGGGSHGGGGGSFHGGAGGGASHSSGGGGSHGGGGGHGHR